MEVGFVWLEFSLSLLIPKKFLNHLVALPISLLNREREKKGGKGKDKIKKKKKMKLRTEETGVV